MGRLKIFETTTQNFINFAGGNPGAITTLFELQKVVQDKTAIYLITLDKMELYEDKLYMLWNDCCNRDISKVIKILDYYEKGIINQIDIDEMQDYSYLQYVILNQIFKCRMTILGDKAQTLDEQMRDVLQRGAGKEDIHIGRSRYQRRPCRKPPAAFPRQGAANDGSAQGMCDRFHSVPYLAKKEGEGLFP